MNAVLPHHQDNVCMENSSTLHIVLANTEFFLSIVDGYGGLHITQELVLDITFS